MLFGEIADLVPFIATPSENVMNEGLAEYPHGEDGHILP